MASADAVGRLKKGCDSILKAALESPPAGEQQPQVACAPVRIVNCQCCWLGLGGGAGERAHGAGFRGAGR